MSVVDGSVCYLILCGAIKTALRVAELGAQSNWQQDIDKNHHAESLLCPCDPRWFDDHQPELHQI